jgi:hypothetical protein
MRWELNEWRDQSGIPRLEEPSRGDGFNLILSGEVEVVLPSQQDDEQNMDDDCDDDLHAPSSEDMEEVVRAAAVNMINSSQSPISAPSLSSHQFSPNVPALPVYQDDISQAHSQQVMCSPQSHQALAQSAYARQLPHTVPPHHAPASNPVIATQRSLVSYENPAMIYDGYHPSQFGYNVPQSYVNGQLPPQILTQLIEMEQKAAPGWYNNSAGQLHRLGAIVLEVILRDKEIHGSQLP